MNNIYLLGYMGSGKSTIGKKLARKLNLAFIDLDKYIEAKQSASISELFEQKGELDFRNIERQSLIEVSKLENKVISLGGGTPCFFDNMKIINNASLSIYLKMSTGMLVSRLINAKIQRPLIRNKNREDLYHFIENQLEYREPFYSQARIMYNASDVNIDDLLFEIDKNINS